VKISRHVSATLAEPVTLAVIHLLHAAESRVSITA